MFGADFGGAVQEIDHPLVVTIHEIDLETLDAHVGIMFHDAFHVALEGVVARPEDDAHIALAAIFDQFFQVDLRHYLHQVCLFVHGPSLVEDHVFDPVLRGEPDIILIGFVVDARLEIDVVEVPCIPPLPGHFSGFDPRGVGDLRGRGEAVDQIVVEQLAVVLRYGHYAPRERPGAFGRGDVRFALRDQHLQLVVAALFLLFRIGGEHALQHGGLRRVVEEEARITLQVGLGDDHLAAAGKFHQHGQEDQFAGVELRQRETGVGVLERIAELPFEIEQPLVPDIGGVRRIIGREGIGDLLVLDQDAVLFPGRETVGQPVVVKADYQPVIAAHRKLKFVVVVADAALLVERRGDPCVGRIFPGPGDFGVAAQHFAAAERHRDGRRGEQRFAVGRERDPEVGAGGDGGLQRAVGRGERVVFLCHERQRAHGACE